MIKVKIQMADGSITEFDAAKILEEINAAENVRTLQGMKWSDSGKKDFLMGKMEAMNYIVAEPLSEEDAEQAVEEYKEIMGIRN